MGGGGREREREKALADERANPQGGAEKEAALDGLRANGGSEPSTTEKHAYYHSGRSEEPAHHERGELLARLEAHGSHRRRGGRGGVLLWRER